MTFTIQFWIAYTSVFIVHTIVSACVIQIWMTLQKEKEKKLHSHMHRCGFESSCCLQFLDFVKISFLKRLAASLPRSLLSLDSNWPAAPPALEEVTRIPGPLENTTCILHIA